MTKLMRKIVKIDEDKCNGCGLCVPDCAEGAIKIIDGKAHLLAENLCDGIGNCLGACPQDAITIEQRPADEFDEVAVEAHLHASAPKPPDKGAETPCGCPGAMARKLTPKAADKSEPCKSGPQRSRLENWPVQLTLVPPVGEIWDDADVLIAADCVSYAMADFHERLLSGKTLAIACPKLDDTGPYVQKLAHIFANNSIKSVTVARMEVPCCGIDLIVGAAIEQAGVGIPVNVVVVSVGGEILSINNVLVA